MRNFNADVLPIYENGFQVGEICLVELLEFIGSKDDPQNVYFHKIHFDLWTAVILIREKKEKGDADLRKGREQTRQLIKKRAIGLVSSISIFVLLLGAALLYVKRSVVPGSHKSGSDQKVLKTVVTAKGKTSLIILSDGTKIWLNAESSLRFPATFDPDAPRKVFLNGEGYFEVQKKPSHQPFIVMTGKQSVEVLGTQFNVNAYSDETSVRTTLLEGSVKVIPLGNKSMVIILKPSQMTTLAGAHIDVQDIDTAMVTAWKRGEFIFRNEPLEEIMRVLVRWYNLEVSYENDEIRNLTLGGSISRSEKVSEVLKMLELTGDAHFKIEGRKIVIK